MNWKCIENKQVKYQCHNTLTTGTNIKHLVYSIMGFPNSSVGKESACNEREPSSIPAQEDLLVKGLATHSSILGLLLWLSW